MKVPYICIELSGSAKERGRIYGEAARDKIRRSIENYQCLFDRRAGISWATAREISHQFIPYIKDVYPEGLLEIEGIAEGGGFDFDDILTLNCRSEILFAIPDGCSAIGAVPELAENGHTLLAQTWDWAENSVDTIVALKIKQAPLPSMVIFTEAGIIGGKGVNSAGLGVTLNATSTGKGRVGVPLHLLYRAILNQNSFSHAVEVVASAKRAGCGCFNIGSADGLVGSLEFTPDTFDVLMCEDKALCHTNHYLSPLMAGQDLKFISTHAHTLVRLNVIRRRCAACGKLDFPKIESIFKDHTNYPNSVCKHSDLSVPEYNRTITVYTVLMDLNDRVIDFYPGNTCEVSPVRFTLDF